MNPKDSVTTAWGKIQATIDGLIFITQQILFHDQTEETDGVSEACAKRIRSRQREGWPAGNKDVPKPRSIGGSLRKLAELRAHRDGNGSDRTATANDNQ